jgi:hypothetical protein
MRLCSLDARRCFEGNNANSFVRESAVDPAIVALDPPASGRKPIPCLGAADIATGGKELSFGDKFRSAGGRLV